MFNNTTAGVWNKAASTKVKGVTIPGALAFARNIDCDMQPFNTELMLKTYGYNIEVSNRFFIDDISGIEIGTILKVGNETHEVKKILKWNYYEVFTLGGT
jgi:hypothetical protein